MEFFTDCQYHPLDWRRSLVMQNVRVLCYPLDESHCTPMFEQQVSSVYDPNLLDIQTKNHSTTPYRLIEKLYSEHYRRTQKHHCCQLTKTYHHQQCDCRWPLLDIGSRQAIIDYITREKIRINGGLLLNLLQDGGFYRLDLWQICENNEFTLDEMHTILWAMCKCSTVFKSLSIGGNSWIYEPTLVDGPFRTLLTGRRGLRNLESLRLQQLSNGIDLIDVFRACPSLLCLEISQPSLTGRHLKSTADQMSLLDCPLSICSTLRSLHCPSSTSETGLLAILPNFVNLSRLHCTPFEQLLDCFDLNNRSNNSANNQMCIQILGQLQSLSIMHPLSNDACERLIKLCPELRHIRVEVQQGMNLVRLVERLTKLNKLELTNSPSMPLDYTEHVQPALDHCGRQLESLSLELFDHINMTALVKSCPNLKHLSAQWFNTLTLPFFHYYERYAKRDKLGFQHLERLRLRPRPHQSLSETMILFFLKYSHHLQHIELYSCSELTDISLETVACRNSLRQLQSFIIRHGHNVTNRALFRLLSRSTCLVFHDCGLGRPEDFKLDG